MLSTAPGAWSWGDRTGYWVRRDLTLPTDSELIRGTCNRLVANFQGYGGEYQKDDNFTAYEALVQEGITLIDTAEVTSPVPL